MWHARTIENTLLRVFPPDNRCWRFTEHVLRDSSCQRRWYRRNHHPKLQKKPLSLKQLAHCSKIKGILSITSMKDLMEKRLASMVDRPWAKQLWAMNPAFSSARQIASSPSFQFQLGMFSRWAFIMVTERGGHRMRKTHQRLHVSDWGLGYGFLRDH